MTELVSKLLQKVEVLDSGTEIVMHAGKVYYEPLLPHLKETEVATEIPTEGKAIGKTMQWYDEQYK